MGFELKTGTVRALLPDTTYSLSSLEPRGEGRILVILHAAVEKGYLTLEIETTEGRLLSSGFLDDLQRKNSEKPVQKVPLVEVDDERVSRSKARPLPIQVGDREPTTRHVARGESVPKRRTVIVRRLQPGQRLRVVIDGHTEELVVQKQHMSKALCTCAQKPSLNGWYDSHKLTSLSARIVG